MNTDILFILDRSSSMGSISEQAVEGFNAYLKEQKKNPKGKRLTLLQFDDRLEYIYKRQNVKDCEPLVHGKTYITRGCTALLDAIGTGLKDFENIKNAIVVIYTDGMENVSTKYSPKKVAKMLKKAAKKGWETLFLAAEIDTTYATQVLGMSANKVAWVSKGDFANNMRTVSTYTTAYASAGAASSDNFQDDIDKQATA